MNCISCDYFSLLMCHLIMLMSLGLVLMLLNFQCCYRFDTCVCVFVCAQKSTIQRVSRMSNGCVCDVHVLCDANRPNLAMLQKRVSLYTIFNGNFLPPNLHMQMLRAHRLIPLCVVISPILTIYIVYIVQTSAFPNAF